MIRIVNRCFLIVVLCFYAFQMQSQIVMNCSEMIETGVGFPTHFLVKAFSEDGDFNLTYEWDFDNDGNYDIISNDPCVEHTFLMDGKHIVLCTVKNSKNESISQEIVVVVDSNLQTQHIVDRVNLINSKSSSIKTADGIVKVKALIINGSYESLYWDNVSGFYNLLKSSVQLDDNDIIFLNYDGNAPAGIVFNGLIDGEANYDNVLNAFSSLEQELDEDDYLIVWCDDHGEGYHGVVNSRITKETYRLDTRASVEAGDEEDYLESDFKLLSLANKREVILLGEQYCHFENWAEYNLIDCVRYKFVSSYSNVVLEDGSSKSDNDVYIEKIYDYLLGDVDKNGWIDENEVLDFNGNGIPPYNSLTKQYDEGDWGNPDIIFDNVNYLSSNPPGNSYSIFDYGLDNKLDIDIDPTVEHGTSPSSLQVDGTDVDRDGIFDGIDVNSDGDMDDWVSIDERLYLYNSVLYDDELKVMLNRLTTNNIFVVMNQCFGGGFVDDLSHSGRVIVAANGEEMVSYGNYFPQNLISAFSNTSLSDYNKDGVVSLSEAFAYAVQDDIGNDFSMYDDNGDEQAVFEEVFLINNYLSVPDNEEGFLGARLSLIGPITPNDYIIENQYIISNTNYFYNNIKVQNTSIDNNSTVVFDVNNDVVITKDFEVKLGSSLEIK